MTDKIHRLDPAAVERAAEQIGLATRALSESDEIACKCRETIAESWELLARADQMLRRR